MNLKPLNQCINLHKIQRDYPNADQGHYAPGSMGSLAGHQVSILPHTYSKEAPLFPQVEKHHIPVQDATLWPINSAKDLQKGYETHLTTMSEDGNNSVPISGCCPHPDRIL